MRPIVVLHPAYVWDCEDCGHENFARAIRYEAAPDEVDELRTEHGIQPWDEGEWLCAPMQVRCSHCKKSYDTQDDRAEDD